MNIAENMKLIYDGAGAHEILNFAKTTLDSPRVAEMRGKALAEYLLRKVDYANMLHHNRYFDLSDNNLESPQAASRQVNHIHHNCQKEIESKWSNPPLTDSEAAEMLFQEKIEPLLAGIAKTYDVTLS